MDFSDYIIEVENIERSNSHALLKEFAAKVKQMAHEQNLHVAVRAIALRGDAREELTRKVSQLCLTIL